MKRTSAILAVVMAVGSTIVAPTQSSPLRRVVGHEITGHFQVDARTQTTTATATLTFVGTDGGPTVTIDFVTRYPGLQRATSAPKVVDVIVTEHPADEDAPELSMRMNGESLPLIARLQSRRSVATTISFDEFVRLTNAQSLVQHAFGTELEFSSPQLRLLRAEAQRWSGR